jgi:DNA-binding MarR family transcriptional regulator
MYLGQMDVSDLHRLGRRLTALARTAAGADDDSDGPALTPGQEAVLEDVLRHGAGTVTEIQARTGFTQSHVSASVAALRDRGLIEATPDPHDRRRTRLTATPEALATIHERAGRTVAAAVDAAVVVPGSGAQALAHLEALAHLLGTTPATPVHP